MSKVIPGIAQCHYDFLSRMLALNPTERTSTYQLLSNVL
jgi:hypothetical protein